MNIINKIKQIRHEQLRKKYAKTLTGNMGRVEIESDRITCYITKSAMKTFKNETGHHIGLRGSTYYSDEFKNLYDINKPIYYIFENINFNFPFFLHSGVNAYVIIRNCTFNTIVEIIWCSEEIIFENNTYNNARLHSSNENMFFRCKSKKLKFINEVLMNTSDYQENNQISLKMNINVDEFNIFNSFIYTSDNNGCMKINAKKTQIRDSIIDCPSIEFKSNTIDIQDSCITADKQIIIDNENNDEIANIEAREVLYNGILITADKEETITINEQTVALSNGRMKLIDVLSNLKKSISDIYAGKSSDMNAIIETQSISKTLK